MSTTLCLRPKTGVVVLACVFSVPAFSAQPTPIQQFDALVIKGVSPSAATQIMTHPKQPRQPLPASDGSDYLSTIPGFNAIRNGGANSDPVLRGMFGSRLAILTNGTYMPGACPSRMDSPTSYISPQNFDELLVVKGPQTVLWGPGASAGIVRFDRNAPQFTENTVIFDGALTAGSWGRNDQSADVTVGNSLYYARITANHARANDYKDGDGNKVPSKWKKWNSDVALGLTPNETSLVELSAGVGDGHARYAGRGMDGTKFRRESVALRYEQEKLSDRWQSLRVQLYHNYADHVMDNFTLRDFNPAGGMAMPMVSNVDRATWGGRVAGQWQLGAAVTLDAGVDYQNSRHRVRRSMGAMPYKDEPRVKDAHFTNTGVFAEMQWAMSAQQRWIGGLRFDRATVQDTRANTGMGNMLKPNPTHDKKRHETLPSGFFRYEQDLEHTTLYAGVGHVQRMPDYWELISPNMGPAGSVNAFEAIQPEKTTQLDIGLNYQKENLSAWASAYVGQINDYILFDYLSGGMMGMRSQARNIQARIMGAEMGADYVLSPNWKVGANAAYAWGKNRSDGRALPQMPPLEARFNVDYERHGWSAGAVWRVVAKQTRYARYQGNVVGKDFGASAGFSTLALHAGYQPNKTVRFTLGVDNVFDKAYAEHLNLAGNAGFGYAGTTIVKDPGRTVWATLNVNF
ncbi:TonB-dependent copper receptor [Paenalcaligenes sp.]|uniref:TonB-dependent copper receptor n=1 Tax=Paenalcaligenes sp. TaxID=1966342 RepID=UPI00262074ED|nr:TonB-dependent copper receptor [Paenalcaligenes sp.]